MFVHLNRIWNRLPSLYDLSLQVGYILLFCLPFGFAWRVQASDPVQALVIVVTAGLSWGFLLAEKEEPRFWITGRRRRYGIWLLPAALLPAILFYLFGNGWWLQSTLLLLAAVFAAYCARVIGSMTSSFFCTRTIALTEGICCFQMVLAFFSTDYIQLNPQWLDETFGFLLAVAVMANRLKLYILTPLFDEEYNKPPPARIIQFVPRDTNGPPHSA